MRQLLIAAMMLGSAQAGQLRITVYDRAHLPRLVSEAAFDSLRQIFHRSGIEIELVTGDPTSREASLLTSPGTPRKGSERETACRARTDIALEIVAVTPPTRKNTMMGMAEPFAWEGLNARVFDDHVRDAAARQNRDHAAVLAHAIAHEIGHVLLRSSTHSQRGLMSAMWTDLEYDWMARGLMFFAGDQSKVMRSVLSGAGCPVAAEKRGATGPLDRKWASRTVAPERPFVMRRTSFGRIVGHSEEGPLGGKASPAFYE
jgi:hypothetical protein